MDKTKLLSKSSFKGTLMLIWKSTSIFVLIWFYHVEDFTLKDLLLFEMCASEICEKFAYKHLETMLIIITMLIISLLFKKFTNFTDK